MFRAISSESPLRGPIYWVRVVSFIPNSAFSPPPQISFDGGKPILVNELSHWVVPGWACGNFWDKVEFSGMTIDFSNIPNEPFPGGIGTQGIGKQDSDQFELIRLTDIPRPNSDNSGVFSGGLTLANNVTFLIINFGVVEGTQVGRRFIKLKTFTLWNPGACAAAGLVEIEIDILQSFLGGVDASPDFTRGVGGSFSRVRKDNAGVGTFNIVVQQAAHAFSFWVPAADAPFNPPLVIDFDGVMLALPQVGDFPLTDVAFGFAAKFLTAVGPGNGRASYTLNYLFETI